MDLTRSQFIRLLAGTGVGALGLSALGACDGSDAKAPDAPPGNPDAPKVDAAIDAPKQMDAPGPSGNCLQNGTTVAIMDNHDHVLVIPKEDIAAGVQKTYTMTGGTHTHPVIITAAMFTMLQNNIPVQTDVEPSGHPHPMTITCA